MTPRAAARAILGAALAAGALTGCSRVHVVLGQRHADAGMDGGGFDAGRGDAGPDGGMDAPFDVRMDTGADSGTDADGPIDSPADASAVCAAMADASLVRICGCDGGSSFSRVACSDTSDDCYLYLACIEDGFTPCDPDPIAADSRLRRLCWAFCDRYGLDWAREACEMIPRDAG